MHAEIKKELIFLDKEYIQTDDYFVDINHQLQKCGFVEHSFLSAIKTRELNFPTGLPVNSCAIAIPHCDSDHIKEPFVSFTRLLNTIPFIQMGSQDIYLPVKMIFMLGFTKDDPEQIVLLQHLMEFFMDDNCVTQLLEAKEVQECYAILTEYLKINEEV